jgi:hypothetical protein
MRLSISRTPTPERTYVRSFLRVASLVGFTGVPLYAKRPFAGPAAVLAWKRRPEGRRIMSRMRPKEDISERCFMTGMHNQTFGTNESGESGPVSIRSQNAD